MGVRVGAIWALIGFAVQCFLAMLTKQSLQQGLANALTHYILWGSIGFVVGTVAQRAIEDSFRNLIREQEQARKQAEASSSEST